ncbi:hypothetical protein GCM10027052_20060 [Parafrigoribacterium mesophilum]|uniref:DUF7665 family protein n=1 Tax=Parafrigoribacterium mesophilum TaxID=433646 RepID=UPI0031FE063F
MSPNELRLRRDLASPAFDDGVAAGHWRLIDLTWPTLTVAVSAGTGELVIKIDTDGYPAVPPYGITWDLGRNAPLDARRWPRGSGAEQTYKAGWYEPSVNAIYLACDRAALRVHPEWATSYPERTWNPSRTITFYLGELHRDLAVATIPEETE